MNAIKFGLAIFFSTLSVVGCSTGAYEYSFMSGAEKELIIIKDTDDEIRYIIKDLSESEKLYLKSVRLVQQYGKPTPYAPYSLRAIYINDKNGFHKYNGTTAFNDGWIASDENNRIIMQGCYIDNCLSTYYNVNWYYARSLEKQIRDELLSSFFWAPYCIIKDNRVYICSLR